MCQCFANLEMDPLTRQPFKGKEVISAGFPKVLVQGGGMVRQRYAMELKCRIRGQAASKPLPQPITFCPFCGEKLY